MPNGQRSARYRLAFVGYGVGCGGVLWVFSLDEPQQLVVKTLLACGTGDDVHNEVGCADFLCDEVLMFLFLHGHYSFRGLDFWE